MPSLLKSRRESNRVPIERVCIELEYDSSIASPPPALPFLEAFKLVRRMGQKPPKNSPPHTPPHTPAPQLASKELFSTREVSQILGVEVNTLERWRREGKGPKWTPVGRLPRYSRENLLAYLQSPEMTSTQWRLRDRK